MLYTLGNKPPPTVAPERSRTDRAVIADSEVGSVVNCKPCYPCSVKHSQFSDLFAIPSLSSLRKIGGGLCRVWVHA